MIPYFHHVIVGDVTGVLTLYNTNNVGEDQATDISLGGEFFPNLEKFLGGYFDLIDFVATTDTILDSVGNSSSLVGLSDTISVTNNRDGSTTPSSPSRSAPPSPSPTSVGSGRLSSVHERGQRLNVPQIFSEKQDEIDRLNSCGIFSLAVYENYVFCGTDRGKIITYFSQYYLFYLKIFLRPYFLFTLSLSFSLVLILHILHILPLILIFLILFSLSSLLLLLPLSFSFFLSFSFSLSLSFPFTFS